MLKLRLLRGGAYPNHLSAEQAGAMWGAGEEREHLETQSGALPEPREGRRPADALILASETRVGRPTSGSVR